MFKKIFSGRSGFNFLENKIPTLPLKFICLKKSFRYVEEYFKTIKYTLNSNKCNSKNINKIKQELYAQVILTILARYLEILSLHYLKNKKIKTNKTNKNNDIYRINHKNTLNILGNKIIYLNIIQKN